MTIDSTADEKPAKSGDDTAGCLIWGLLIFWVLGIIAIYPWIQRFSIQRLFSFPNDYLIDVQIPFLRIPQVQVDLPPQYLLKIGPPRTNFEAILLSILISTFFGIIFYLLYQIRSITPLLVWTVLVIMAGLLMVIIIWTVYNWLRAPVPTLSSIMTLL